MTEAGPFRGWKVHVLARKCSTCIFRPGNLMHLEEGRVEQMVADCRRNESAIICHKTLDIVTDGPPPAVCRGFYDLHRTQPLQIAERLQMIEWDPAP